MPIEAAFFYAFGGLSIFGALAMLLQVRNLVAGLMSLVVTMVSLAGIYVLLEAHLVAVLQIIVYAGAVGVLFLVVVLWLNLRVDGFEPVRPGQRSLKVAGAALAVAVGLFVASALQGSFERFGIEPGGVPYGFGGFRDIGLQLFTVYVVPLEVVSLILLAAIVAAILFARRKAD